ncbi:oxygenase MpaB family protein [Isoptericola sp. AK164]|uniref:oxygenase MpaB family protein n=1 Tax=Isoptericola sp. AK164 TaxID=3024246 RepID=UPI0024184886|nr:oxygenase MpaB family protein [Isoptericola sp. AK164]
MALDDEVGLSKADRRHALDAIETTALRESANWFQLLAGTSNVVMQLAARPVGHGVKDSTVDEGNLFLNPARRRRTTIGYIAVAMFGDAEERAAYRRATNRSHAQVRSPEGAEVTYDAFDPALQLWVAACLYKGAEHAYQRVHGPLTGDFAERFYRQGMVFGTTLQLPAEAWPATREDFDAYWTASLDELEMDDATRQYLMRVVHLEYLDREIPPWLMRWRVRLVTGYLEPRFRELMHLEWSPDDEVRFARFNRRMTRFMRLAPRRLRERPFTRSLRDVRRRLATGTSLF